MAKRIRPTDRFWLVISQDNVDGTLGSSDSNASDWNSDCVQAIALTEAAAHSILEDYIANYGGAGFVYACTPKLKVYQPPTPELPPIRTVKL